jgi:Putative carbonic anhydrase
MGGEHEPVEHYESALAFDGRRVHAAAVYCSDGRLGEQMDDFLGNCLCLPRYDRLAVPGGAAVLASHFATYREQEASIEQLRFLAEVHGLERVVLVAHSGCAFYSERLHVASIDLRARQVEDLEKAAAKVREIDGRLRVEAYFAEIAEGFVRFRRVGG